MNLPQYCVTVWEYYLVCVQWVTDLPHFRATGLRTSDINGQCVSPSVWELAEQPTHLGTPHPEVRVRAGTNFWKPTYLLTVSAFGGRIAWPY